MSRVLEGKFCMCVAIIGPSGLFSSWAFFVRIRLVMRSWDQSCAFLSHTFRPSLDTSQTIFCSCYFRWVFFSAQRNKGRVGNDRLLVSSVFLNTHHICNWCLVFLNTHHSCNTFWGISFLYCCDLNGYSFAMLICFMLLSNLVQLCSCTLHMSVPNTYLKLLMSI